MTIDLIAANSLRIAPESLIQAGLENWIVVAVILAGALQGVGQAVVKKIKQRQEAGTQTPDGGPTSPNDPLTQRTTPPHRRPDRPVARPARMGSGPTPGRRTPTPIQAPRPIAQPIAQLKAPRPETRQSTTTPPVARPTAPQRTTLHRKTTKPQTRNPVPQSQGRKAASKKRAVKKKETVAEHHLKLSDSLRHPATEADHLETNAQERLLPPLTRRSLREAIILREVLGPPVALRNPDQTGW